MRASHILVPTLRETPADAEITSHIYMLRAGLIRQLAKGLYTWLPLGLAVLRKVENIIREELNNAGAMEVLMPVVQPAELWKESGRWDVMGPEMLRMKDRHDRDYCLSPTHEEVVTDLVRNVVVSYKQLPCNIYQINTKFRDEIRPRFGVMRAREFVMKDGYSFHLEEETFEETYRAMFNAYGSILSRIGLEYRAVEADPGSMGDGESHEFHVLAESGEDALAFSPNSDYAANVESAEAISTIDRPLPTAEIEKISTPGILTIEAVSDFLGIAPSRTVKTLIVEGTKGPVALVVRGDHTLNEAKASRLPLVKSPLTFLKEEALLRDTGVTKGSIGPIQLGIPIFVDHSASNLADFTCGANEAGFHFSNVNWGRDVDLTESVDIRNVQEGDLAADGSGLLEFKRGIEVGHIFKLGTKYSDSMGATIQDRSGKNTPFVMGCYGLGVTRIVAAIVEQHYRDETMHWPIQVAPALVHLVAVNNVKSEQVREAAFSLYSRCLDSGIEIYFDDRDERPGVKFADADLVGLPYRITIGERTLANGVVEFQSAGKEIEFLTADEAIQKLINANEGSS